MMLSRTNRERGFTLIEIMIAMAILAVISILSAQTMRSGITDRETVQQEIAADSKVADALRIIRTDVNAAYHHRDIFVTLMNDAAKPDPKQTPKPGDPPAGGFVPPPPPPAPDAPAAEPAASPRPTPPEITGFIGESQSMYFTTLSNQRTFQDSQMSDQAKVGYFVKSCRSRSANKTVQDNCLYRSFTPYLDEEIEKPGEETVLLEHVSQFKLRYVGPGRGTTTELEYVDTWKTGKNGDDISKLNFPYAVEVTLVTEDKNDPKTKKVTASALIPIQFPNNPPKKDPNAPVNADGSPASTTDKGSFNNGLKN
jgi:prepilin-type N-terminal cleavage/methylation domain-containing protein